MLLDDVELLFDEFVDDVQGGTATLLAGLRTKLVLFGFEMAGELAVAQRKQR